MLSVDITALEKPSPRDKEPRGAFCDSINCRLQIRQKSSRNTYVRKDVSFHTVFCPDCGSALLWIKEQDRRYRYRVPPEKHREV